MILYNCDTIYFFFTITGTIGVARVTTEQKYKHTDSEDFALWGCRMEGWKKGQW